MAENKFWMGGNPTATGDCKCDICQTIVTDIFIDGKTRRGGMWANMCLSCFSFDGIGLGQGLGQKYQRQNDKRWLKVEG